jgi:hypothetical protein
LPPDDPPEPQPESGKTGPKLYIALAFYALFALAAAFTLDGNFRLAVWVFLAGLAARTYLHTLRKP